MARGDCIGVGFDAGAERFLGIVGLQVVTLDGVQSGDFLELSLSGPGLDPIRLVDIAPGQRYSVGVHKALLPPGRHSLIVRLIDVEQETICQREIGLDVPADGGIASLIRTKLKEGPVPWAFFGPCDGTLPIFLDRT